MSSNASSSRSCSALRFARPVSWSSSASSASRPYSSARATPAASCPAIALSSRRSCSSKPAWPPPRVAHSSPQATSPSMIGTAAHERTAEPLEQRALERVQLGVVDDADVGLAFEQQLPERVVTGEPVDLVRGVARLPGRQVPGVDERAQDLGPHVPLRDRDRGRVEGGQRLVGAEVDELGERVGRRHRRGHRHQHPQLAAEPLQRGVAAVGLEGREGGGHRLLAALQATRRGGCGAPQVLEASRPVLIRSTSARGARGQSAASELRRTSRPRRRRPSRPRARR